MTDRLKAISALFAIALIFQTTYAQDGYTLVTRDLELWTTAGIKFEPVKKFSIRLDQGFRFNHNASQLDQALTQLSFKIKPVKRFYLGGGIRYIKDRGGNELFDNDLRFQLDLGYVEKLKKLRLEARLRYQNKNELGVSKDEGDYYKQYLRFKAGAKYNISNWKLDPELSAEIFRDLTKYTGGFDNLRFTLGTSYSTKKFGSFGAYYRLERELQVSYPKTTSIIGINYTYTIKPKKK